MKPDEFGYIIPDIDYTENEEGTIVEAKRTDTLVEMEGGGLTTQIEVPYDAVPIISIKEVALVLKRGMDKGYPRDNWKKVPVAEHLGHAISHIYSFILGETGDTHLENATCRLMLALSNAKDQGII